MERRQLEYFVAVVENGGFTASESLAIDRDNALGLFPRLKA